MTAAALTPMGAGYAARPDQSRPALALVVIVHACCIFALVKLIDAQHIAPREPLIVQLLEAPKPEIEKPLPKKKPPEPRIEEPPPEPKLQEPPPPPQKMPEPKLEEPPPPPKEKPPEPKAEVLPPPELPKPDIPPQPLPLADLPPPMPVPVVPTPAPQPVVQRPVAPVIDPPPRPVPPQAIRDKPLPPVRVAQAPVAPQPVVQRPIAPVIDPPPRPAPPQAVRDSPPPPARVVQAPAPVDAPRMPDPTLKVERDVPDARPVALAPREPARRAVPEQPRVAGPVSAPVPEAVAEPQPQVSVLPEPPAGASAEVLGEIALGAEMLRANYLRNPKPLYPAISRRLKEQGTVLLRVFVTASGHPTQVTLKASSGFERLDNTAKLAVAGWKFVPATREEKAVDAWVIVPIKFSLNN